MSIQGAQQPGAGRLAGKVAIITGAASGIGLAVVERFFAEGAHVIAADIDPGVKAVEERLPGTLSMTCDVAVPEQLEELANATMRRYGQANVLCANAGIADPHKPLADVTLEEWDRVIGVNLRGCYLSLRSFIPLMVRSGGGSIIVTSSGAGRRPGRNNAPYAVAKAGAAMLAKAAALDYAAHGIRVNALLPGATDTPLMRKNAPERIAALEAGIPLGRMARADEMAAMALFLASDEASYVTGQGIEVDGGFSVGRYP
jgi:NAD(P)-dependent dehydrogenase (short-subunit alcohol dehydrogenase family)